MLMEIFTNLLTFDMIVKTFLLTALLWFVIDRIITDYEGDDGFDHDYD